MSCGFSFGLFDDCLYNEKVYRHNKFQTYWCGTLLVVFKKNVANNESKWKPVTACQFNLYEKWYEIFYICNIALILLKC